MKFFSLIIILLLFTFKSYSTAYFSNAGVFNWNDLSAWSIFGGPTLTPPGAGDDVTLSTGSIITISSAVTINSLASNSSFGVSLTVNSGASFTVNGSSTILPTGSFSLVNNGTVSLSTMTFVTLGPTNSITNNNTFSILGAANIICSGGDFSYINNTSATTNFQTALFSTSSLTNSLIINGGDVNCQTLTISPQYGNPSSVNIDLSASNGNLNISNLISSGLDYTINGGNNGSTVNFNGAIPQTLTIFPSHQFHNLKSSTPLGLSFTSDISSGKITNLLETSSLGVINQSGFTVHTPGISNLGQINANDSLYIGTLGFTNSGTFTSTGSNINIEGDWNNTGTYTFQTGDVVMFDGSSTSANITGNTNFHELNINKVGQSVTGASGSIEITSILDIDAGSFVANPSCTVTLLSTASGTAQLDEIESGASYTGDLEVERLLAMSNDGWRELTSPVATTTLANWQDDGIILTGFPGADYDASNWYGWINSWTYTEANASGVKDNGWVAATSNTDATAFTKGHRIYIGTGNNTLSVKGTPIQGAQTATISNGGTGSDQNGWNLIGNPYACTIDWNSVSTTSADAAIWIWNATAGNYGIYQTGAGSGTNGVDNQIAHSQAFWVHATGATGSISIQESNKVRNDKAFVKSNSADEFVKIKLSSTVNSYYDEAILTFNESANDNFNQGIDQNKLFTELEDLAPSLAFVTADNAELSIAGINELKSRSIPLKAYAGNTAYGTYTIEFELPANSLLNSCITLEDLETGSITDLKTVNNYTFTTTSNSPQNRFILHITAPFETETIEPSCSSLTDGMISLEGNNINGNTFTISNSNGVLNTINGSSNQISFSNLTAGTYTITSTQASSCGYNSIEVTLNAPQEVIASFTLNDNVIYLDQNAMISPVNSSIGDNYTWDFGDGNTSNDENPTYSYTNPGIYTITLTVEKDGCETTTTETIEVRTSTSISEKDEINYTIISNDNNIIINLEENLSNGNLELTSLNGKIVLTQTVTSMSSSINTSEFAKGIYLLTISSDEGNTTKKVMIK